MEIIDELNTPSKSELSDDELLELLNNSASHIETFQNSLRNLPELIWVASFDGNTKISLVSPNLTNDPDLFNSTENINFDYLDFYEDVQIRLMNDSLIITTNDSIIRATKNWKVEFNYEDWFEYFKDYSSSNDHLNEMIKSIKNSDVYAIKSIPINKSDRFMMY
ncbi:MAG: hypothetical protein AAF696_33865, partial [Bacteroidota bacterium]